MYLALPKNERSFAISEIGDATGTLYEGTFVVRCILTISEKHQKEMEKTRLLSDYSNPTPGLTGIAEILSTLRIKMIKWPEWWNELDRGVSILDENIIVALYEKTQDVELAWRAELREAAELAKKPANSADSLGNP